MNSPARERGIVIDCLQYCRYSEAIFRDLHAGGVDAIHVTIAYHEDFRETVENIVDWNGLFARHPDLIFPGRSAADVRRAREKIKIPPVLQKRDSEQNWTALDLERAFADANPGLRTDMMSVSCRRGVLEEVRICLSKDLRGFRTCQEVDRSGCRARDFRVNAIR